MILKHLYIANIVILFLTFGSFVHAQTSVKRASLSTAPVSTQKGTFLVQQSVGHMGIMTLANHGSHSVSRGFLLPQLGASSNQPIPDFDWTVYPNPFRTYINIDFSVPVSGDLVMRLHDVTGQLIMEKSLPAKQQQRIDLGHLAQAEYLLTAEIMGKIFSQTLLNYKSTQHDKN